eukprot:52232-Eustigmatos_ZCMA.PRE.1
MFAGDIEAAAASVISRGGGGGGSRGYTESVERRRQGSVGGNGHVCACGSVGVSGVPCVCISARTSVCADGHNKWGNSTATGA